MDYPQVGASEKAQEFYVLADKTVTVSESLTKSEVQGIGTGENAPTLTFTAYAVQQERVADAAAAWGIAQNTSAT